MERSGKKIIQAFNGDNIFIGSFNYNTQEGQFKKLVWFFWITLDNWMHAQLITGLNHLNEEDFLRDVWNLLVPYLPTKIRGSLRCYVKIQ